jgi:hypothetical protein
MASIAAPRTWPAWYNNQTQRDRRERETDKETETEPNIDTRDLDGEPSCSKNVAGVVQQPETKRQTREIKRGTDKAKQRERDRQTKRETDTEIERDRQRETEREIQTDTDRNRDKETERLTLTPAISMANMAAPRTWPAWYAQNFTPSTTVC